MVLCGGLAVTSLVRDSITFDETKHFAAGLSHLKTGDFRLSPDTPPLSQMVLALPGLFVRHTWPNEQAPGWRHGDVWVFGRHLLYDLHNSTWWIIPSRCMAVLLLLVQCLLVYVASKSMFGPQGGLISLFAACLCPSLLAHGRLVATDFPITLACFATIFSFSHLMRRCTLYRLVGFVAAMSSACLTKFSWPAVIPSLLAIGLVAVLQEHAIPVRIPWKNQDASITSVRRKLILVLFVAMFGFAGTFASIWACYGFRYAPYRGPDADVASMLGLSGGGREAATDREQSWNMTMEDARGRPMRGLTGRFVRATREWHLLPEAYLFGLAFTKKTVQGQPTYLLGEVYDSAKWQYFPIAFFLKTPLMALLWIAVGIVCFVAGISPSCKNRPLAIGLSSFILVYFGLALSSNMNLGQRHLLPIYPAIYVLLGKTAGLWQRRWGRMLMVVILPAYAFETLSTFPNYLAFFNGLAGGRGNDSRYLIGSNLDWGQDLIRLKEYTDSRPGTAIIKLAYSGSAKPGFYGIACEELPSHFGFDGPPAMPEAGTYVVSLNQLYGLYTRQVRDAFWDDPRNRRSYRELTERFSRPSSHDGESEDQRRERQYAEQRFHLARQWRLLNRLRHRSPDERVGSSFLVYHLTAAEIDHMLIPY